MDEDANLTGKLLIAMPAIEDDRFTRSVILICAHSDEHAMGIVVNKTFEGLTLPGLLDQLDIPADDTVPEAPVLFGGPVGKDRGFVIHTEDFKSEYATIEVNGELCLTATKEVLHAIGSDHPPRRAILALGYSGWGPQQLETELAENVWLVTDADSEIVFDHDLSDKWQRALAKLGITADQIQGGSGRA